MSCPNCRQDLDARVVDNQTVLYCLNCGSSFFEENGINRITVTTAQKLAKEKKQDLITGYEKHCPKDAKVMSLVHDEESVPHNVALFRCETCRGIFVYPDDLVRFKMAQGAKINFFQVWNIPPASVASVLVLTFLAVLTFTFFSGYFLQQQKTLQAQDVIKNVNATRSGRYLLISFRSQIPLRTKIVFVDRTINKTTELAISSQLKTLHFISTSEVNLDDEIYYQIVGIDGSGKEIKTEGVRLKINP